MPQIMIIDDHEPTLEILRSVLEAEHSTKVDFVLCSNDAAAAKHVKNNRSQIAGYIQDLFRFEAGSGSFAGIRFFSQVIDVYTPLARVVIHSGHMQDFAIDELQRAGGDRMRFVSKHEPGGLFPTLVALVDWILDGYKHEPPVGTPTDSEFSGQLQFVRAVWHDVLAVAGHDPRAFDALDSRDFEELVAELFRREGWEVELTSQTRDGGYDIIAIRRKVPTDLKLLIEAKRYSVDRPVEVSIVRSLYGVRGLNSVSQVVLATSSFVSAYAKREFARVVPWELDFIERDRLSEWCRRATNLEVGGAL